MPIIELSTDGRTVALFGGARYSTITAAVVSLPNHGQASLQVSASENGGTTSTTWNLQLMSPNQLLCMRFLPDGEAKQPSDEWLINEHQSSANARRNSLEFKRESAFKCHVKIHEKQSLTSLVKNDMTFQLTFECHPSFSEPRLQVACISAQGNSSGESWLETTIPFHQLIKLRYEEA
jgi:hypothetical protein